MSHTSPATPTDFEVGPHPRAFLRFWFPIARAFAWCMFAVLGPVRVEGKDRVPRTGALLILANHLSDIDPVVVQFACPRPIHFMAKSELFEMKVIGWLIRQFRGFPVKRGEPDRQSLKHSVALLKEREVVGVFPEGEISETTQLLPLKPGIALIARQASVPVICCGLRNTQRIMPYSKIIPRPAFSRVDARWGEPRTFGKDATAEQIVEWAHAQLLVLTADRVG